MSDDAPIAPSDPSAIQSPRRGNKKPVVLLVLALCAIAVYIAVFTGGGNPAKKTARQFIEDMSAGNIDAAKKLCTSEVDWDEMNREARRMEEWGKLVDAPLTARKVGENTYDVGGNLEFANIRKFFNARLVKQADGTYRIQSVKYQ